MSNIQEEAFRLKEALGKSAEDGLTDKTYDILAAISKLPVTKAILKSTNLVKAVKDIIKAAGTATSSADDPVTKCGKVAGEVMAKWQAEFAKPSKDGGSTATPAAVDAKSTGEEAAPVSRATSDTSSIGLSSSSSSSSSRCTSSSTSDGTVAPIPAECLALMTGYADYRKKIVNTVYEVLLQSAENCDPSYVCNMAIDIEAALFKQFGTPHGTGMSTGCFAKYRMLLPNLKRNEELRNQILDGMISGEMLMTMSVDALATQSQKEMFEAAVKYKMEATSTEFYDERREKMMAANGLDPNVGGEFVCKCGSNKTVFHSLQTRSSDEPMTNFIRCLKCGRRWKD